MPHGQELARSRRFASAEWLFALVIDALVHCRTAGAEGREASAAGGAVGAALDPSRESSHGFVRAVRRWKMDGPRQVDLGRVAPAVSRLWGTSPGTGESSMTRGYLVKDRTACQGSNG